MNKTKNTVNAIRFAVTSMIALLQFGILYDSKRIPEKQIE